MCPRKSRTSHEQSALLKTEHRPKRCGGCQPCHVSSLLGQLSRTKRLRARCRTTTEPRRHRSLNLGCATKPSPKFPPCPGLSSAAAAGRSRRGARKERPGPPGAARLGPNRPPGSPSWGSSLLSTAWEGPGDGVAGTQAG